jgi:dihydropteroate synthase
VVRAGPASGAHAADTLRCGRFELPLARPLLMGVLNVTPDSFSDGGRFLDPQAAIAHGRELLAQGADIVDIGAESTRPGAPPVSEADEIERLAPVVQALVRDGHPVSVDTRRPAVMRRVLDWGADMINDVGGFGSDEAVRAVRGSSAACCVMHMHGDPLTMQQAPVYRDVVGEVRSVLQSRVRALLAAGVERARIVVDPGIGFGKTLAHNLQLLAALPVLAADGYPVLVGVSRKSMIGALTGRRPDQRLAGSLAAMLAAVARGARIVRVHDVAASRDALTVWESIGRTQSWDASTSAPTV